MPIALSGKVLVTGGNGYIAMWVVQRLLQKGYSVRTTVRSDDKGRHLKEYFGEYAEKLEVVTIPDMTREGAYDDAVKGVTAVQHVASPVNLALEDPDDYIEPARKGTKEILKSALQYGHDLKRIVITSSMAAMLCNKPSGKPWTEEDWNDDAVKAVNEHGAKAGAIAMYGASKTLAERDAWDLFNEHRGEVGWDMTSLLPASVFGPAIHEMPSQERMNESLRFFWDNVISETAKTHWQTEGVRMVYNWVDVRDLADAHVLALENEVASGERINICRESFVWQDWIDIVRSLDPCPLSNHKFAPSFPDAERAKYNIIDASKSRRILGMDYRTKEECAMDMLRDFAQRGW